MRILFLTLCGVCCCLFSSSQIYKARCILLTTYYANDTIPHRTASNTLIVYNTELKRLSLYNPNQSYDLIEFISQHPISETNPTLCTENYMIDQNGIKMIGIIFTSDKGITGVNIQYKDVKYSYYAEPLNN
ncbi:MAG TPA: hypothetical protein VIL78_17955 [Hanamia sp.]